MNDALGIDAGSSKTVLACVKQRGIEIVLSETSGKSTPTVAAYTDQERLIGDSAVNQSKRNFKNTLQFFGRFMGLNQDCAEQIRNEKRFVTYKVVNLDNKKIGFELECRGQKQVFTPEQVMGFYLKRVKTFFEKANMKSNDIVISVPSYATNAERQAYIDAAEIAGIKCVRLLNESTSQALTYGFFRKMDLDEKKARRVVFVDFGHSKLACTYAHFTKNKMKVQFTHCHRNLGARNLDYVLFDVLANEFDKKYGCDPRENPRARLRLLDGIEKARKLLTSNKEADVICEALMEDNDLRKHLSREEFETMCAPFIDQFRQTLEEFLTLSGKFSFVIYANTSGCQSEISTGKNVLFSPIETQMVGDLVKFATFPIHQQLLTVHLQASKRRTLISSSWLETLLVFQSALRPSRKCLARRLLVPSTLPIASPEDALFRPPCSPPTSRLPVLKSKSSMLSQSRFPTSSRKPTKLSPRTCSRWVPASHQSRASPSTTRREVST